MITDLLYLWLYRERPQLWKRWMVVWAKRALMLFPLLRMLFRSSWLRWKGADLGSLVTIGRAKIGGNLRNLTVGSFSSLGVCEISLHDQVWIGKSVVINDGVVLLTASHDLNDERWRHTRGEIRIDDYAWIATNAIICPGITIGRGAVIGAGAVVRQDISPYTVVIGNPAQTLKRTRTADLNYFPTLLNAPLEAWIGRDMTNLYAL
jgi:acetyltransferase-like isoleucine patch superfamily enzyme